MVGPLSGSATDPLRSRQAVLVAVVGVLLFLIALVFLTANSAEAQACISEHTSSFDLIASTTPATAPTTPGARGSGHALGVIGLIAAVVVAVGRSGLLVVLGALGIGGRR